MNGINTNFITAPASQPSRDLNGLKPYLYLTYVLERLRQLGPFPKPEELDSLLPWAEDLPEEIKTKTKPKK
ncbi:MAG: transposase domain-containing protein [Anaerobutyricum hallii]|jgi:hypothetical protein|nr:transposase domain-containing protein [Anaerobutyricum hallii]